MHSRLHVVAGVIHNRCRDLVLVARRLPGSHLAGLWEFPGGKLHPGEDPLCGLIRELLEEINIEVTVARPLILIDHDYQEKSITLDVWSVEEWTGDYEGREGQELKWLAVDSLDPREFPAADRQVIAMLRKPILSQG
ncbi:MAG: 8-oxo-dGTP diphosphatase MutT [Gammaproteobacteria bacterium]|nr:MAG: 8-oxo-dGTP diphosphatase MutT [Gammaproteobacteria bacterium]